MGINATARAQRRSALIAVGSLLLLPLSAAAELRPHRISFEASSSPSNVGYFLNVG